MGIKRLDVSSARAELCSFRKLSGELEMYTKRVTSSLKINFWDVSTVQFTYKHSACLVYNNQHLVCLYQTSSLSTMYLEKIEKKDLVVEQDFEVTKKVSDIEKGRSTNVRVFSRLILQNCP